MLAVEGHLPYQGREGFSAEQQPIRWRVSYFRLLYRQASGTILNQDTLLRSREQAQTDLHSCNLVEIRGWLSAAWGELRQYRATQEIKREQFLDQLIAEKDTTDCDSHKKDIERIKKNIRTRINFIGSRMLSID